MHDSMDELVRLVTEQVLAALNQENKLEDARNEGKKKCLVLGRAEDIPQALMRDMIPFDVKDYETVQNILRYSRVVITKLTMRQLADIAMGRPGDSLSCAVCHALLQGVEVLMLESAAPHRQHAGKGSTAFYRMLEGYMNTLQVFGIKLIANDSVLMNAPEKKNGEVQRCEVTGTKLITEEIADRLAGKAQEVVIPAGTLITPAAMDVFKEAHVKLIRR